MQLRSDAFEHGQRLPLKYAKDGENISQPLRWTELPAGTRELAVLFESITPQTAEPYVHWVAYQIPPDLDGLPEGLKHARDPQEPVDVLQGKNSLGNVGYDGPLGTAGRTIRCRFRLLALDQPLDVAAGLDRESFLKTAEPHILAEAELLTSFESPSAKD